MIRKLLLLIILALSSVDLACEYNGFTFKVIDQVDRIIRIEMTQSEFNEIAKDYISRTKPGMSKIHRDNILAGICRKKGFRIKEFRSKLVKILGQAGLLGGKK